MAISRSAAKAEILEMQRRLFGADLSDQQFMRICQEGLSSVDLELQKLPHYKKPTTQVP